MPSRMGRALALRPVNSVKHVIDVVGSVQGTATTTTDLAIAVDDPDTLQSNQVHYGSNIRAIYLKVEAITIVTVAASGSPSIYIYTAKNPSNEIVLPNPDQVGVNNARKWVFHQEMRMLSKNSADNFPRTIFEGVIRLPRKYQRMGIDDRLQLVVAWSQTVDGAATANFCVQCIYKEFF